MSDAARTALASVLAEAGWRADAGGLAIAEGASGVASPLPFSDIAAGAYGALALAAARFGEMRGGGALTPPVDRRHAGLALVGNAYLTIDGEAPQTWGNITGYYRCGDGEWVYLHGIFPHLRDGLLELFEAEDARDAMAARLADWTADAAEAEGQARGLCVMKVRSRAAWDAHAQRAALAAQPLIDARRLSDVEALAPRGRISPQSGGRARPDRAEGAKPLAGMRALDLTRVIAGPMAGRALAELGADVLRVSAAHLPSIEALVVDTGFGKRNAEIDLLLVNLKLLGWIDRDLSALGEYCVAVSEATGVPIPSNYPVIGTDAFETATGVHAAAVIKAYRKGDDWLADRIYSGVPAGDFGFRQKIRIGPMSAAGSSPAPMTAMDTTRDGLCAKGT